MSVGIVWDTLRPSLCSKHVYLLIFVHRSWLNFCSGICVSSLSREHLVAFSLCNSFVASAVVFWESWFSLLISF